MKAHILLFTAYLALTTANAQNLLSTNEFPLDLAKSELHWYGSSLFQINEHDGKVQFKKGFLKVQDGKLWGGSFIIDMTTIKAVDGGANDELDRHLKNEDFFDVKKYPTAWLSIQQVSQQKDGKYEIEANLNIKGITQPILFTAELQEKDHRYWLTTTFIIDRSRWNIEYGRNSGGVMDPMKNYSISDAIKFEGVVVTQ